MDRAVKTEQIGQIRARFDKMTAAVFLDYKGMTVESATKLRAEFRKAGVEYKVCKNTLVKQALKGSPYADKLFGHAPKSATSGPGVLTGMTGIAWS
jgi:large subunit ribosomal protein L10